MEPYGSLSSESLLPCCLQQLVRILGPQNERMNDAKHLGEVGSFIVLW